LCEADASFITGSRFARPYLARRDIRLLKTAIGLFEMDNGRYPTTKEGLDALVQKPAGNLPNWHPYLDRAQVDPWGHPYVYTCPGSKSDFDLYSCGPDGKPGTDDDVK
jgi:general secretion pathway protein G